MVQTEKDWLLELARLPVGRFLSESSWSAIRRYLESGATSQRGYRLLEFFKALDWLPLDEIEPNPLWQFSHQEAEQIRQEITSYFQEKDSKREARKKQRESHRMRVFEYYRSQISSEDKALLERLRDYELERIGEDVNWRHYFWFTSFKQIDAFTHQTAAQRQAVIEQFKQDVEARYRNEQRLRDGSYAQYYWGEETKEETFDEWANRQTQQTEPRPKQRRANSAYGNLPPEMQHAYRRLELAPSSTLKEVRQQFRRLTLRYHPDMPEGSDEKMKQILAAYELVKKVYTS